MENQENFLKRIVNFAESKGFYMILGLCVVAIGVSAYVLFFTTPDRPDVIGEVLPGENAADVSGKVPDVTETKEPQVKEQNQREPLEERGPAREEDTPAAQTQKEPVVKPVQEPETPPQTVVANAEKPVKEKIFTLPVQSAVVERGYSGQTLVKDPTMGDWRTHGGTDFLCDEGDDVIAVLDGAVTEIFTDAMMGQCIRLDHGSGLESLYCGVIPHDGLKVGKQVTVGQKIGRAANDTLAESAQECHLHLEMTEEGIPLDPMTVLK